MIRSNTINLEPMTIYHHIIALPETTVKITLKTLYTSQIKYLVDKDKKRYLLINFIAKNGATYLFDKSINQVIGKVNRKSLCELDIETAGLPMRYYEFV